MNRRYRTVALLVPLALAVPLLAQSDSLDALKRFGDQLNGISAKEKEDTAKLAGEVNAQVDGLKKFLLIGDAQQLAGENGLPGAAVKLGQSLEEFRRKPLPQLTPLEARAYRDILLELGRVLAVMGDQDRAARQADEGWKAHRELCRPVKPVSISDELDHIGTALKVGMVLAASDRPHEASERVAEALEHCERLPGSLARPEHNPLLAQCWLLEGSLAISTENYAVARDRCRQALDAYLQRYPPASYPDGAPEVTAARLFLAAALASLGDGPRAMKEVREARRCLEKPFPKGHPALAAVCRIQAQLHLQGSEYEEAMKYIGQARKECERCFPREKYKHGHPELIQTTTALAALLNQFGRREEALKLNEQAWQQCRDFYGAKPHDNKVFTLLNHGRALRDAGNTREALLRFGEALTMARVLYPAPEGHPLVAQCLLHLGSLQGRLRQPAQGRATLREAEAMYRRLYPGGSPQQSAVACYLGVLALQSADGRAEARAAFASALAADREQLRSLTRAAAEVEVLTFMRHRHLALAGYLTATRDAPDTDEQTFAALWDCKGTVTRLAEARRAAVRLAGADSPEVRRRHEALRDTCAEVRQLLASAREPAAVAALLEKRDRLELELADRWPDLRSGAEEGRRAGDLAATLPAGTAFVDFVRYDDLANGKAVQACYAAFVVAPGRPPRRVELGPAELIDQTIRDWRKHVAGWSPDATAAVQESWQRPADELAARLRKLVWEQLDRLLPEGTGRVYLAPDGDLALFPFAALPGKEPDSILLEELTLATVPHGPFLLARLAPAVDAAERPVDFLALGEVNYGPPGAEPGPSRFAFLAHSGEGLALAERAVAPDHARTLRQSEATFPALCRALSQSRQAHLSTHGFFEGQKLDEEARRLAQYLRTWTPDQEERTSAAGLGRRFPLSYVGLALSGANDPGRAEHGGILTGEAIAELRLDGLSLVTLSACETALGEHTAGEGIQGLQRAFHLAGCPNVVATLWSVPDRRTGVLMQEFYHQLWDDNLSSLDALRQAQLAIYHNPDRVPGRDPSRGPFVAAEPDGAPPVQVPSSTAAPRRTHVQCWGAFIHSGVGQSVRMPLRAPVSSLRLAEETAVPAALPGRSVPWAWPAAGALLLFAGAGALWRARRRARPVPAPALLTAEVLPVPAPGEGQSNAPAAGDPPTAMLISEPAPEADEPGRRA